MKGWFKKDRIELYKSVILSKKTIERMSMYRDLDEDIDSTINRILDALERFP